MASLPCESLLELTECVREATRCYFRRGVCQSIDEIDDQFQEDLWGNDRIAFLLAMSIATALAVLIIAIKFAVPPKIAMNLRKVNTLRGVQYVLIITAIVLLTIRQADDDLSKVMWMPLLFLTLALIGGPLAMCWSGGAINSLDFGLFATTLPISALLTQFPDDAVLLSAGTLIEISLALLPAVLFAIPTAKVRSSSTPRTIIRLVCVAAYVAASIFSIYDVVVFIACFLQLLFQLWRLILTRVVFKNPIVDIASSIVEASLILFACIVAILTWFYNPYSIKGILMVVALFVSGWAAGDQVLSDARTETTSKSQFASASPPSPTKINPAVTTMIDV